MPAGGRRTASEALQFGFQYINRVPYVWGGGALPPPGQSGGGIDCSHFVWRCFNYPQYYNTTAMVTTNCLAQYDFIKMSYSYSTVEEGDIVVFDGHTGIACDNPIGSGNHGVLQSYGSHGVGWLAGIGGGSWTHIWRPKEGAGLYIKDFS